MIHESAIIDPTAKIADNVKIGAYSIIDRNVSISEGELIQVKINKTVGDEREAAVTLIFT